jgi:hypothetical protein
MLCNGAIVKRPILMGISLVSEFASRLCAIVLFVTMLTPGMEAI